MSELTVQIVSGVAVPVVLGLVGWVVRKAIQDLKSQITPNGGSSLYDQAKEAKDLASKAVELGVLNEARLKQLETKVDALILSRIP
ncbi:hypothetical protein AB0C33_01845 [Nonomuraea sp. NPDC048881]|uniref:hypothetical protein n=1 Tax=Nonomuraea sp. NPDC048881 TaxID=3155030 RepID=UPI0033C31D55